MKKIAICILTVAIILTMSGFANTMAASATSAQTKQEKASTEAGMKEARIAEAEAKEIALKHAGLSEAEVTFSKSQLDKDDGRTLYDIEFYVEQIHYDYEIDAYTGDIYAYEYDIEFNATESIQSGDGSYIGLDEVKSILLSKAGLTAGQVTYTEASFEYENGIAAYHIEFYSDGMEYEFEIDAVTGAIVEYDVDND